MCRIIVILLTISIQLWLAQSAVHPFYPGLQMGIGADSSINSYHATALEYTNATVSKFADGQKTEWSLTMVSRSQELNSVLNLGASASFKFWDIDIGDVASFAQSSNLNQYSTQLLVQVSVKNAAANIPRPALSKQAEDFLTQFGLVTFQKVFGPEYLGGVLSGGMYLGMITVDTQSKSEKKTVSSGVKFAGFGINLGIDISKPAQAIFKKRRVEVYGVQIGGQATSLATTIQAMIDQLQVFPSQVLEHPVPIEGLFNNYETTIPWDWSGQGIDYTIRNNLLQLLSSRLGYLKDRQNDLLYVQEHYDQFQELKSKSSSQKAQDMQQISEEIKEISTETNTINNVAAACVQNTSQCVEPTFTYSPVFKLPQQNDDIISESVGMSMLYFGHIENIPYGWQLCDGSSGTSDLRGRFALGQLSFGTSEIDRVGYASNQGVGDVGGASSKALSIQEMPSHSHYVQYNGDHNHNYLDMTRCTYENTLYRPDWHVGYGSQLTCSEFEQTSTGGSHNHGLDNTGGGAGYETVPPYAVVYYICKVK